MPAVPWGGAGPGTPACHLRFRRAAPPRATRTVNIMWGNRGPKAGAGARVGAPARTHTRHQGVHTRRLGVKSSGQGCGVPPPWPCARARSDFPSPLRGHERGGVGSVFTLRGREGDWREDGVGTLTGAGRAQGGAVGPGGAGPGGAGPGQRLGAGSGGPWGRTRLLARVRVAGTRVHGGGLLAPCAALHAGGATGQAGGSGWNREGTSEIRSGLWVPHPHPPQRLN